MPDVGTAAPPEVAPGVERYQFLLKSGMPAQQADQWRSDATAYMQHAGLPQNKINEYWGEDAPASPAITRTVGGNLQRAGSDALKDGLATAAAGFDHSVIGLQQSLQQGKEMPTSTAPKNLLGGLEFAAGQEVGDFPTQMLGFFSGAPTGARVGGIAGGAVGAAIPGADLTGIPEAVGGAIGAAVGGSVTGSASAAALTESTRQALLTAYRNKEVKTASDALRVAGQAYGATAKATLAAGVAGVAGPVAGRAMGVVAPEAVAALTDTVANAATNTAVTGALNHQVPDAQDFFTAAGLAIATHVAATSVGGRGSVMPASDEGTNRVAKNLQDIYVRTGIPPWEAVQKAQHDPGLHQEIFGQDVYGDPSHPQHTYGAPDPPEPFTPAKREFGAGAAVAKRAGITPGETVVGEPSREMAPLGPREIETIGHIETGGERNPDAAVSSAGAIGRYQIMPATARQYGFDPSRLHDPEYNEMVSRTILADLNRRYGGNEAAVFIGYNAGPKWASRYLAAPPGTRLVGIPDKGVRGGVRYEQEPADRDETFLPRETQEYLAKGRMAAGHDFKEGEPLPGHDGKPNWLDENVGGTDELQSDIKKTLDENVAAAEEQEREGEQPKAAGASAGAANVWENAPDEDVTAEILSNVGEVPEKAATGVDRFGDEFMNRYVSELTPWRRLDDRLVQQGLMNRNVDDTNEDAARRANYGTQSTVAHIVTRGGIRMFNDKGQLALEADPNVPSFYHARDLALKAGNGDEWLATMLGQRTVNKGAEGIDTGFNPMASAEAAKRWGPKYQEATSALTKAQNSVLQFAVDGHFLSQEAKDNMVAGNPVYLPMRHMLGLQDPSLPNKGKGLGSLRRMQGVSDDGTKVVNPFLAAIDNASAITKATLRNMAARQVVQSFVRAPDLAALYDAKEVSRLDPNEEAVAAAMKQYGFTDEQIADPKTQAAWGQLIAERLSGNLPANQFRYRENGQTRIWQINDPMLAKAIAGAETPQDAGMVMKALQAGARAVRTGITLGAFIPRMVLMHQFTQAAVDPLHPTPLVTFAKGFLPAVTGSKEFGDLMAAGGLVHVTQDLSRNELYMHMGDLNQETGFWNKAWNVFTHPLEAAEAVATRLDAANRVGVRKVALAAGQGPAKASMSARRTGGTDWAERGTSHTLQRLASIVPFLRPKITGMKADYDAYFSSESSVGTKSAVLAKQVAIASLVMTLPAIANFLYNREADKKLPDGQKWSDYPDWQKFSSMLTPSIAGQRFTLRYPPVIDTLFVDLPTRALDYWANNDPHAFDKWADDFRRELMGDFVPGVLSAPHDISTNHNSVTGQPLVPDSLKNYLPEARYEANTSVTGRNLAKFINPMIRAGKIGQGFSPIQFDYLVSGEGSEFGKGLLGLLDAAQTGDTSDLGDITGNMFVKGLVARHPEADAQPLQDFYTDLDAARQEYATSHLHTREARAAASGQTGISTSFGALTSDTTFEARPARLQALEAVNKRLTIERSALKAIEFNKQMTLDEKRQYSEGIYDRMIGIARTAQNPKALNSLSTTFQ